MDERKDLKRERTKDRKRDSVKDRETDGNRNKDKHGGRGPGHTERFLFIFWHDIYIKSTNLLKLW